MESHGALTIVLALAVGVAAQSAARHLRVPGIVLLLLAGASLGPDGLGWVRPRPLGEGLYAIVDLAVAVILFEGGLNLEISRLRRAQAPIRRLVTFGALITLVGGMLAARWLLEWSWTQSLLFGSLVVVTGPTVIGPLVQHLRLRPRVATVLEAEGVLIDPIGALLAVLSLEIVLGVDTIAGGAGTLLARLGFGLVAGVVGGFLLGALLRARRVVPEGHENIFALASVLLLFEGCETVLSHSGILAVTIAGVVVGNLRTRVDRDLREFKDQLTVMLIGLLFVLLAADVRIEDVRSLGWEGVGVVAVLVLLVRPLGVWICTWGSDLAANERHLIAWIAPRGIVAAAVASITATALESRELPGGTELRALVFLTISGTVLLAGFTAQPVAALLRQRLPGREGVAILGAHGLGMLLGKELREGGLSVLFLDSNPQHCRAAEEAGFPVVFGDALQERTQLRARLGFTGSVVGCTPNQMLNSVYVGSTRERFGVPRGFVAVARPELGLAAELVKGDDVHMLFEGPHDVGRWDVRERQDAIVLEHWTFAGAPEPAEGEEEKPEPSIGEKLAILAIRRGRQIQPMSPDFKPKEGDVAAIALHRMELDAAREVLRALGWAETPVEEPETA